MVPLTAILTNWRLIAAAGAVAGAFFAGWLTNGWRWEARQADLVEQYRAAEALAADAARRQSAEWAAKAIDLDRAHTAKLFEAQNEIDALRSAVAAGSKRLHVRATCPPAAGVPGAPTAPGVDDGAAPRLAADAEQYYFTLISQLSRMEEQLRACQGWIK